MITKTPNPPYYAVIFTSLRRSRHAGYEDMSKEMIELVKEQDGFLGLESARNEIGITVSYWDSLDSIKKWKNVDAHKKAQQKGKKDWYDHYKVRICKVERDYGF